MDILFLGDEFKGVLSTRSSLSVCSFVAEYSDVCRQCLPLEMGIIFRESVISETLNHWASC